MFMREATESHRGLFPEHAHAYGANVRAKLECCLVVHAEFERGRRRHAEIASGAAEAIGRIERLVTRDHRDGAYVDLLAWAM